MAKLNKYDFTKLLDDIKLISKTIKIIADENNPDNRKYACSLAEDLVSRLYRDIKEMTDLPELKEHGGTIKEGQILEE